MFKTAALREDSIVVREEYASAATSYISTCDNSIVPPNSARHTLIRNPGLTVKLMSTLRARSTAFLSGDAEDYKKARYDLCRSISKVKGQYKLKLEGYYTTADPQRM